MEYEFKSVNTLGPNASERIQALLNLGWEIYDVMGQYIVLRKQLKEEEK